jgi:hypothetical protein
MAMLRCIVIALKAKQYYREAIGIPMRVNLTDEDLQFVASSLRKAMGA